MDALEAIYSRRSVRSFRSEPVPRDVLERIVAAGIEAPSGCNMQLRQYIIIDDEATMAELREVSPALTGAPAAIVVVMDPRGTQYGEFWIQDASAAIENMLLAAVAEGYASCWIEGQVRRGEEQLARLLEVPEELNVWAILPIGLAEGEARRPKKSEFHEVVYYNRFGTRAGA